ncbi:hypothetical protein FIBSPDRAFT_891104 [Athelia psychrophila]|uniref:RNI-like protein n=1 Tax=Athelia psychrophila TaxID=1759441 RepID=A0A166K086_9AGAM|nr:hypothetical protein FIBSPDRAFT_891104 [Fibularhizoctonia sp. CBS 109695]
MPTFPGEVCDLIIDQLGVSKECSPVLPSNRGLRAGLSGLGPTQQITSVQITGFHLEFLLPSPVTTPGSSFISACDDSATFTIRGYTSGDSPRVEDIVTILGSLVKLTRLELYYFTLGSFIQLRDIRRPKFHFVLCGRLLRAIGSKLEHLSLQFGDGDRYKHVSYENVDLRYNSRLETLSFWGCGAPVIRHNGLDIINRVSSSNLRELNISLDWLSIGDLNRIEHIGAESLPELAAIDTLLQHPNFSNLEGLNIGLPRVVDSMQNFFPRTSARDLLHVMCYSKMEHLGRHTQSMKKANYKSNDVDADCSSLIDAWFFNGSYIAHLMTFLILLIHFPSFDLMLEGGPEGRPELAAIDTLLQRSNFANLEGFNIGVRSTIDSMQEIFPRTAARNLLRVMDSSEMWKK